MAALADQAGGMPSWIESLTCRNGPANCVAESDSGGKADWSYVGEGRGGYRVVEQIVWVGEGNGSVDVDPAKGVHQAPPIQRSDWSRWKAKCCMIFYQGILCMILVCLVTGTIFAIPSATGLVTSAWDGIKGLIFGLSDEESAKDGVHSEQILVNCSALEAWFQKNWRRCCHSNHNGCHQVDCGVNRSANVKSADSGSAIAKHRHWCCSADFRAHCNGQAHGNSSASHSTAAQLEGNVSAPLPYDCQVGLAHWEKLWKPDKQQFCCKYGGVGCTRQPVNSTTAATVEPTVAPTSSSTVHKPQELPLTADGAATTVQPADGARRSATTMSHTFLHSTMRARPRTTAVSAQLQSRESPGNRIDTHSAMEVSRAAPRKPPAAKAATAFNCDIGIDQWKKIWSVAKKFWCCEYGNRCPM
mmetsp:Transcript_42366/g.83877  ORF Transcript_42366/g.83877 Transcript_42366/m.83877 type:complete len:415 (+) Transcript_42366:51-1295(+)